MPEQMTMFDDNPEYQAFVDKFKPKKTTDDCYTPPNIYDAVADWVEEEYGVPRACMARPFYPGGDFEAFDYSPECVVVDNPPFSILARILKFYTDRGVRFFLFAPTMTLFTGGQTGKVCYLPCGISITYDNGAKVNTSFITSLDDSLIRTVPELYQRVKEQNKINEKAMTKSLPKYRYPDHVLTAAAAYRLGKYGQTLRIGRSDAVFIRRLDAMRSKGKDSGIFGGAYLLNERAAAERAAAERAAATVWELSEREKRIVAGLGTGHVTQVDPFDLDHLIALGREEIGHA